MPILQRRSGAQEIHSSTQRTPDRLVSWSIHEAVSRYSRSGGMYDRAKHFNGLQPRGTVTYCLGIVTTEGLVMASDSRSNAGFDQVNVCRKMYRFVTEGERVFVDPDERQPVDQPVDHLAAARRTSTPGWGWRRRRRCITPPASSGDTVRQVSEIDRAVARARQLQLQRQPAARRPGPRRASGAVPDLPAGQSAAGHRGLPVPAARRVQIRAPDSRSRHRGRPRRSRSRPSTRCCRSTRRCDRTSRSGRRSTCFCTRRTA